MRLFNRAPVIHIFLAFVIFAAVLWMPLCPSLFAADAVSTEDSADAAGLEKSNPAAAASSADLNGDGRLGIGDLGIMAASYGRTSADPDWQQHAKADLNGDGIVDIADLTSLASQILLGKPVEPSGLSAALSGPSEAAAGGEFETFYGLTGLEGVLYAHDISVTYDPEALEFLDAVPARDGFAIAGQTQGSGGQLRIIAASPGLDSGIRDNGPLLKLRWKVRAANGAGSTTIAAAAVAAEADGREHGVKEAVFALRIVTGEVDKTALRQLIAEAQAVLDAASEGTMPGQYPSGAKALLAAEIGRAELVEEDAGAAADAVARAVSDLTDALQSFQSSVNAQEPGDINNDGRHSVGDLGAMAVYYGKSSSDPDWDRIKAADLTGDGVVDIEDLARLAILILG